MRAIIFCTIAALFIVPAVYSNWALTQIDWESKEYLYFMPFGKDIFASSMPLVFLATGIGFFNLAFGPRKPKVSDE